MKRDRPLSVRIDVPSGVGELALRRTAFAMERLTYFNFSLRQALACAYLQGMNDTIDVLTTPSISQKERTNEARSQSRS